jgi:hypothetical protein
MPKRDRSAAPPAALSIAATLAIALLSLVSLGWVSIPDVRTGGVPAPPSTEALLIGSSSVGGAVGIYLGSELRRLGIHLSRRHQSSSGWARPDFYDWGDHIDELGDLSALRAIFIYMGGNDAQMLRLRREEEATEPNHRGYVMWGDDEQWSRIYRGRVLTLVNALCEAGGRHRPRQRRPAAALDRSHRPRSRGPARGHRAEPLWGGHRHPPARGWHLFGA